MNRHERRALGKQGAPDPRLQQGLAAFQAGRLGEADAALTAVLAKSPREPTALHVAGLIAFQQGRIDAALARLTAAIRAKPDYAEAHNNFGRILLTIDRPGEAADRFRAALKQAPDIGEIHGHLGEALLADMKISPAAASFRKSLILDPRMASTLAGLGTISTALGAGKAAQRWHRAALALISEYPPALRGLGEARLISGEPKGAIAAFETALRAHPHDPAILGNLAAAWREAGRLDVGIAYQRRILALQPAGGPTLGHLSQGMLAFGRPDEAVTVARRRMATESSESARKSFRASLLYLPGLSADRAFAERRRAAPVYRPSPRWKNPLDADRKLRVAYVSSDFRDHPVARSLLPLIENHDRDRFHLHLYGEVAREDEVSRRFQAVAPYRSIIGLDDAALADTMRADGIDIAVFVAGSFDANRLEAAAHRCAPVQISLHDGATSGIAAVDALIADPCLVPAGERRRFTERVLRLPDLYLHMPIADAPEPALPDGPPVFATAANPAKLNRRTLALWSRVLEAVPDARLALRYRTAFRDESLRASIEAMLPPDRIDFAEGDASVGAHLASYRSVHVALDTWPFSGSTSSFEALWMGVPVIALAGSSMAERWTAAILKGIGREEWIARNEDDYVRLAATAIRDRPRLAIERQSLRAALAPLTDGKRRAHRIECFYRALWRHRCRSTA